MKISTILLVLGLSWIVSAFVIPTDSTDRDKFKRSNMNLRIDYGTGCQYLSGGGFFGKEVLIPRVDKDGKHVCN